MVNDSKKANGVYYTPTKIADYLVRKAIVNQNAIRIFDPAYGEGALLSSAANRCIKQGIKYSIHGCDISKNTNGAKLKSNKNIRTIDFFNHSQRNIYDVILMNPPYIRHHTIENYKQDLYRSLIQDNCRIHKKSDLWAYFLIKSAEHLIFGGSIAAILPWSFLQADYSIEVRKWILERFEFVKFLALGRCYFKDAKERVVLVWLSNYGQPNQSIKGTYSYDLNSGSKYVSISRKQFEESRVTYSEQDSPMELISILKNKYGFQTCEKYSNIKIGVVTGANRFFVMDRKRAKESGIHESNFLPIITSSRFLKGLSINGYFDPKNLLYIDRKLISNKLKQYISQGIDEGLHKGAHATRREPWYKVKIGEIPDAFFPYRIMKYPYIVLNDRKYRSTNSVHGVCFNNLTLNQKRWFQISLLSYFGQLSLELYSKVYGEGVLKIEPRSFKNSLIYLGKSKISACAYREISKLLIDGKKADASKEATMIVVKELDIPDKIVNRVKAVLNELQDRRVRL